MKTLLALMLFFSFGYWSIYIKSAPDIQQDIESRTHNALHSAGYDSIQATVKGRDVILNGTVANEKLRAVIEKTALVEGVRFIENNLVVSKDLATSDYYLQIEKKGNTLDLKGNISDAITHHNFVAFIMNTFKTNAVNDQLIEKKTPPNNWTSITRNGVEALKNLEAGMVRISSTAIELSGEVSTPAVQKQIISNLKSRLPKNVQATTRLSITKNTIIKKHIIKKPMTTINEEKE